MNSTSRRTCSSIMAAVVNNLVIKRASGDEIKREAIKSCEMITLRMDGINKALQGLTTLEQAVGASTADE